MTTFAKKKERIWKLYLGSYSGAQSSALWQDGMTAVQGEERGSRRRKVSLSRFAMEM
jgi:hypothetical protein